MNTIETMTLGASPVRVARLGVGVMTWGPAPKAWFNPAKQAYGGPANAQAEAEAFEAAVELGTTLFDTAEMYSSGGSEVRLGELAEGRPVLVATKFPPSPFSAPATVPEAFSQSLVRLRRFLSPFRKKDGPALDRLVALLTTIGARYGKTPGQVALRWLLENPLVLPIPGAKNAAQVKANAGALSFRLTKDEVLELNETTQRWL